MRAGRAQAMASMSFPADTAAAMLHVPAAVAAAAAAAPSVFLPAPQMPLSAAHQVSPVASVTPTPAVGRTPEGPRGWAPLVATTPGRPAFKAGGPQSQLGQQANGGSAQGSQQQPQTASHAVIKSYSPADALTHKVPAVAACSVSPDEHMQAMEGVWNNPVVVNGDDPAPAQHAEADADADSEYEELSSPDSLQELSSRETSPRCLAYGCMQPHTPAHDCTPQQTSHNRFRLHPSPEVERDLFGASTLL